MKRNWKLLILSGLIPLVYADAQSQLPPQVANATGIVEKELKPDHQSQFFKVVSLGGDSLLVESTSLDAIRQFDSILPSIPKKIQLLPESYSDGKNYGIVKLSVTNHRAQPAQAGELITQALMGTTIRILKKLPTGYFLVQTPDNYIGYVDSAGIVPVNEVDKEKWESSQKVIYTELYGTVYTNNDKKSLPVSDIVAGDRLRLLRKKGKFFQVQYPNGEIGFVIRKSAQKYSDWVARNQPTFDNILESGKKLMGTPYLWGGTSVKGVDCSGFMRTIFYMNGILLPRDASQQARVGEQVDIYENGTVSTDKALKMLQSGDLLFFGTKRKDGSDKVTHVALYMGNGRFIQASGYVKISDFSPSSPYYDAFHVPQLLGARRILTHIGKLGIASMR